MASFGIYTFMLTRMKKIIYCLVLLGTLVSRSIVSQCNLSDPIPYKIGDVYGYANDQGEVVISPRYSGAGFFSAGYARVKKGKMMGVIDIEGKEVVPLKYEGCKYLLDDAFSVLSEGSFSIYTKGRQITHFPMDMARSMYLHMNGVEFKVDGKKGFAIIENGAWKELIPPHYVKLYHAYKEIDGNESKVIIAVDRFKNKKVYDLNGMILAEEKHQERKEPPKAVSGASVIEYKTVLPPPPMEEKALEEHRKNGTEIVEVRGKYYLIKVERIGEEKLKIDTLPGAFESIEERKNLALYMVKNKGKWGLIDKGQNYIMECKYDSLSVSNVGHQSPGEKYSFLAQNNNKWGLIELRRNGERWKKDVILKVNYDYLAVFFQFNNYVLIFSEDGQGVFDLRTRKHCIPAQYKSVQARHQCSGRTFFNVTTESGVTGYVDDRGMEYFKD